MSKTVRRSLVIACALAFMGAFTVQHLGAQAAKEPTTVVLKASNGNVTFNHATHSKAAGKCETCHHPSKPEKKNTAPQQKCSDCHTNPATAPMKTKTQAAFHDPMAKKGICIDCHMTDAAKAKKAPTKCTECHVKA